MEARNKAPRFMKEYANYRIRDYMEALGNERSSKYTDIILNVIHVYERGLITIDEAMQLINEA